MNKSSKIEIRVTENELELIDKKAEVVELNRSQYIRKMAIEGYIIKRDFSQVEQLVYEVNKIGNNINQIARRANELEHVSLDDMKYLKKQLDGIYSQIEKFYDGG
jgi:Trp operon repressor